MAATPQCLVSFDSAQFDVCEQRFTLVNKGLHHLADLRAFADSGIRIVKFDGPVGRAQSDALTAIGAEILGYVPFHGYKVRMSPALDAQAREIPGVIWTGPYLPVWKVGINLTNELAHGRILWQAGHLDSLWVSLHPGVSAASARGMLEAIPGTSFRFDGEGSDHEFIVLGFEQRSQLPAIVDELAANENVNAFRFHWPAELMNSQGVWLHQSGDSTSQATSVFDQGIYGCGQIGGALDSGLHTSHCSFEDTVFGAPVSDICNDGAGCSAITPDFNHRKVGAHYQWRDDSSAPGDAHGHGTFVSGNFVGNNTTNEAVDCETMTAPGGLTNLDGMAPGAQFVIQEAGPSLEYLNFLGGSLYHAATVAHQTGVYIHNNSWGSSCRGLGGGCFADCIVEYRPNSRGGDMAVWENPELLIFAAAGNSGGGDGSPGCGLGADVGSPGNAKSVFSIGATQRGTLGDNMAEFSSRGPTSDRRTKPDMVAQGDSLVSSWVSPCGSAGASGTSFSSPIAAGLSMLVREYLQRGFYPLGYEEPVFAISNPSAALIKAIMINGSAEVSGTGTSGDFPDVNQGWGRILLDNSLYFDGDDRRLWLHDGTDGLETDDVDIHTLAVDEGEPLTITLVWHDFPAEENADPHIVNSLRLEVQAPGGAIWTQKLSPGGGLADSNPFQDTTLVDYDDRNTVHQITFDAPVSGAYEVRVRGIQVAMGGQQPYALVATGNQLGVGEPSFILKAEPTAAAVCQGDDAEYEIGVLSILDFDDPVDLSLAGEPVGASVSLSVDPVTPDDPAAVSVLTIVNTAAVAPGEFVLELTGESSGPMFDPSMRSLTLDFRVDEALSAPGLLTPEDGDVDVDLMPKFAWGDLSGAAEYQIQVATDAGFGTPVIDKIITGATFIPADELASGTVFFWRVRARNACGESDWTAVFEFRSRFKPIPDVTPEIFTFILEADETDNDTLTITNIGTGELEWTLDVAEAGARGATQVFLEQDFEGNFPPAGWSTVDDSVAGLDCPWLRSDEYSMITPSLGAGIDSTDCAPPGTPEGDVDTWLVSPELDLSGSINTELSFDFDLNYNEPLRSDFRVDLDVSTDGGSTWYTLWGYRITGGTAGQVLLGPFSQEVTVDLSAYDGEQRVILRWRSTTGWGWWAFVDNVVVSSAIGELCLHPALDSWLSAAPAAGTISAGNSSEVTIEVDSTGRAYGRHMGALCVETNAPENELVVVPVKLEVTGIFPTSFDFTLTQDNSADDLLYVGNASHEDLVWSIEETKAAGFGGGGIGCANPSEVSWLSVSPDNGTTPRGQNIPVTVSVDTTGLLVGEYNALLCVTTNDTNNSLVEVPVHLTVEMGPPIIDTSPGSFEFDVVLGDTDSLMLTIDNTASPGANDLDWNIQTGDLGTRERKFLFLEEDFEGSFPPAGWRTIDDSAVGLDCAWLKSDAYPMRHLHAPSLGAGIDSEDCAVSTISNGDVDTSLLSPELDLSSSVDTELAFDFAYNNMIGGWVHLDVSTDGGATWATVKSYNDHVHGSVLWAPQPQVVDLSEYDGESSVSLRWRYVAGWHFWAFVDNVSVSSNIVGLCTDPAGDSWLSVDVDNGITPAGDSHQVQVSVDSVGLSHGSFLAALCINTNAPDSELVAVPVNMNVTDPTLDGGIFSDRFGDSEE